VTRDTAPAVSPASSTGRTLGRILWPLMIAWAAFVAWRAYGELNADYTVDGLFRTYRAPYDSAMGSVIDPRPQLDLSAEIARRYAPDLNPTDASPTDEATWRTALGNLGLTVAEHDPAATWTGAPPRLRLTADGPHLLIGLFGVDLVALVPGVGVVRIPEGRLPPATVDLALVGAQWDRCSGATTTAAPGRRG